MTQIRANGVNLEVETHGPADGIPLIMIHGFGQQLTAWPAEFLDGLAAGGLRLVLFDNRDVGLSQKWDGQIPDIAKLYADLQMGRKPQIPYTLDDMAADAAGLLDALGIASAHILGCSMGGMIAQLVALNHPGKSRSLISMFSTTGDPGLPPATPEAIASLLTHADGDDRASLIAHVLAARRAYASTGYPYNTERIAAQVGASYDRMYYPEGAQRHWSAILAAPARTERLKKLTLPALVLHGSADTLVRPEAGRHTAQCIEGSEYHEIDGWGHDMPLGVIPKLLGYILDFVGRVEATRHTP
jgi:pimeloyl-ACP methyl ester carboxylesterase